MMLSVAAFLVLLAIGQFGADAYSAPFSRRQTLQKAAVAFNVVAIPASPARAIQACPPKSSNCIRTAWVPPAGTSPTDMANTVRSVLSQYPKEGQSDVDKGGWTIVQDDLAGPSGTARVEYKSGIGNFAKFFNGGKPFVDDLVLEMGGGRVEIRSASRVGDSDLGVNAKRLQFLAKAVRAAGWDAPEPKY